MKKIAVVIANGQTEGLRIAAGLSLLDDKVDIFLLDNDFLPVDQTAVDGNLKMIKLAGIGLYSNFEKEGFLHYSNKDMGKIFPDYDFVIRY